MPFKHNCATKINDHYKYQGMSINYFRKHLVKSILLAIIRET